MPSYEPVDLSAACNAGVEVLGDEPGDVPLGRVDLRGLPFLIGSEPPSAERCFLLAGIPVPVGIGRLARRVIVAHRLLEPGAPAGHAVGQAVAEYVFHLAGGEVVTARIRERFEIQVVPPGWGRLPFLAVTDTSDRNLPRFEGRWGQAGIRLVEHAMGWPAGYYLWCWENPHPERSVERIEFIPRGMPSATVAVRQGGDEPGRVRWGDVERDGRADVGQVSPELMEGGRNWVHVSVVDDATGRPVPCRVHFRSAEGIPYQPHGHHNHVTQNLGSWHYDVGGDVRLGQRGYAYIDGRWPTPKASDISGRWSRVPANTYGTLRSGGPTSSRRTITARPTTSPGWSGRSPRPCARWKSAAAGERIRLR